MTRHILRNRIKAARNTHCCQILLMLALVVCCSRPAGAQQRQEAQHQFKVGQKVTFQDVANRYGGGVVSGTIVEDMGSYGYKVKVDAAANPAFQTIALYGSRLTAAGAPPAVAKQPNGAGGAKPRVKTPGGNQQAVNRGGDMNLDNRPKRGNVMVGGVNPNPTLGHNAITPPGRKAFYVHSRPGDEAPTGRWDLRVGGQFTNVGGPKNGQQLQEYGLPEQAEVMAIKPDGTWHKNNFGKKTSGKWVTIGDNVVRLIGYGGADDDYTASVYKGQIDIVNSVGQRYQGRRF